MFNSSFESIYSSTVRPEPVEGLIERSLKILYLKIEKNTMIIGIGIDSVEIKRFSDWHTYSQQKLSRIFSEQEIEYCLRQKNKSTERFAVRFAAKEAFFKAFCSAYPQIYVPFLTICKFVSIQKQNGRPILLVDWKNIIKSHENDMVCHISLTHTQSVATAFVMVEK
jgi:holo-[acyl-carrier protein] synthase